MVNKMSEKKKETEVAYSMEEFSEELNIPVPVIEAFQEASGLGLEDDSVKVKMAQAGAKFSAINRWFTILSERLGMRTAKSDADALIAETFGNREDLGIDVTEEEGFGKLVDTIQEAVTGWTENKLLSTIRKYAKDNDITIFKSQGRGRGATGFRAAFYDALRANPKMDEATFKASLEANGSNNDKRNESHYNEIRKLINDVAAE